MEYIQTYNLFLYFPNCTFSTYTTKRVLNNNKHTNIYIQHEYIYRKRFKINIRPFCVVILGNKKERETKKVNIYIRIRSVCV